MLSFCLLTDTHYTENGVWDYTAVSVNKTVADTDIELPVDIGVSIRKSNAGRDFITLNVF